MVCVTVNSFIVVQALVHVRDETSMTRSMSFDIGGLASLPTCMAMLFHTVYLPYVEALYIPGCCAPVVLQFSWAFSRSVNTVTLIRVRIRHSAPLAGQRGAPVKGEGCGIAR